MVNMIPSSLNALSSYGTYLAWIDMGFVVLAPLLVLIVYKIKEGMVEMKHLLKIIMVMALTGFMSGCSELEEIEERGFVVGGLRYRKEKKANPIMKGTYQMVLLVNCLNRVDKGWG